MGLDPLQTNALHRFELAKEEIEVSFSTLHKGLSAESSLNMQARSKMIEAVQKRSTASIVLQVAVGLLTGGIGAIGIEIYHQFNKRQGAEEFSSMAGALLEGMQGMPDSESGFSTDYQNSRMGLAPVNGDVHISFGTERKVLCGKTMAEVRENLKRNILSDVNRFGVELAKKALRDETPHQRSQAVSFLKLRGIAIDQKNLDSIDTKKIIEMCEALIDGETTKNGIEERFSCKEDPSTQIVDEESHDLIAAWVKQSNEGKRRDESRGEIVYQNATVDTGIKKSRASQDKNEKDVRNMFADIFLPIKTWESDRKKPEKILKAVLLNNSDLLARIYADPAIIDAAGLPESLSATAKNAMVGLFNGRLPAKDMITGETMKFILECLPDEKYQNFVRIIDHELESMEFNSLQGADLLATIDTGGGKGNLQEFLQKILKNYFNQQFVIDKRAMLASYMRESGAKDSNEVKLVALLKGGGPYLQKLLQLLGDNATGELKEALNDLKTDLGPINKTFVDAALFGMVGRSEGKIERIEVRRSLGAASVGQAFLVNIYWKGKPEPQEAVIKLLRPGIRLRAERERKFFEEEAGKIGGMSMTFNGISEQVQVELDLEKEAANVRLAQVYGTDAQNLQSMKLIEAIPATHSCMVLEKAPGITANQALNDLQALSNGGMNLQAIIESVEMGTNLAAGFESLTRRWVEEALFGSGFYHGDLHAGNIMFSNDKQGMITAIDMGNACVLSFDQRRAVFKMVLAAGARNAGVFVRNYEAILSEDGKARIKEKRADLLQKIQEIMNNTKDPSEIIVKILDAANVLGLEIPATVSNFSRSQMMLQNSVNKLNLILKDFKFYYNLHVDLKNAQSLCLSKHEIDLGRRLNRPIIFEDIIMSVVMSHITASFRLAHGDIFSLGVSSFQRNSLPAPALDNPPEGTQYA